MYMYIHVHRIFVATHNNKKSYVHVYTGATVCKALSRLLAVMIILKVLNKQLEHLFPLTFTPR